MAKKPELPAACCGQATWREHHAIQGRTALACERLVGKGGALYIGVVRGDGQVVAGAACAACRYGSVALDAKDPAEFVNRIIGRLAAALGPDATACKDAVRAIMAKGASGMDLAKPEAREFVTLILERACAQGLSPDQAIAIAKGIGIDD